MATDRDRVFKLEQFEPEPEEEDVDSEFIETLGFMTQQQTLTKRTHNEDSY